MDTACKACGSREVRRSHRRGIVERLLSAFGWFPHRCEDCRARFFAPSRA